MNVLLIEDEQLNADLLTENLQQYSKEINVVGLCKSKQEVKIWLENNDEKSLDLVFSDIELLDGNVFSLLEKNIFSCPIIFTTAYNDFYQNAFDANGIAYLLKPISFKKLSTAIEKFEKLYQKEKYSVFDWDKISELIHGKTYKERIVLKNNAEITILTTKNIGAILSNEGKLIAIDENGKSNEFRGKLSELITELNPKEFFQINRSEIININFVEKIEPYFGDRLSIKIKNYKPHLITSASTTAEFRKWLEK